MLEWTSEMRKSPDRLDALVYAVTDLMLMTVATTRRYIPEEISAV